MLASIRSKVECQRIPNQDASLGYVTISIGIAGVIPGKAMTAQSLIQKADKHLYLAKHNGRNQIVASDI